jgi:hypothetical protein
LLRVEKLFKGDMDLMKGFYDFLPDRSLQQRMVARLDEMEDGTPLQLESRHGRKKPETAGGNVTSSKAVTSSAAAPQKRKRKPVEKDKGDQEKDKHKEIAPRPGPSKVRAFYDLYKTYLTRNGPEDKAAASFKRSSVSVTCSLAHSPSLSSAVARTTIQPNASYGSVSAPSDDYPVFLPVLCCALR